MKQELSNPSRNTIMWLALFTGTAVGSVLWVLFPDTELWQTPLLRQGIGTEMAAFEMPAILWELCGVPLVWLIFMAVLGTSLCGRPAACMLLLLRGAAIGAVLCGIYHTQGAAGILTACLFVIPFALTGICLFLLAAREASRFSAALCACVLHDSAEKPVIRPYLLRFLVLAGGLLLSGTVQNLWLQYGYPLYLDLMAGM